MAVKENEKNKAAKEKTPTEVLDFVRNELIELDNRQKKSNDPEEILEVLRKALAWYHALDALKVHGEPVPFDRFRMNGEMMKNFAGDLGVLAPIAGRLDQLSPDDKKSFRYLHVYSIGIAELAEMKFHQLQPPEQKQKEQKKKAVVPEGIAA